MALLSAVVMAAATFAALTPAPASATTTPVPEVVTGTAPQWSAAAIATSAGYGDYPVGHSCALTTLGGVKCWGINEEGQVGIGNLTSPQPYPMTVTLAGSGSVARLDQSRGETLAVGHSHSCVIYDAPGIVGGVQCWGANTWGQLGDGTVTQRTSPVVVKDQTGTGTLTNVVAIATGDYDYSYGDTCAITAIGALFCWGQNQEGELGIGSTGGTHPLPLPVSGIAAGSGIAGITVGDQHSCAWFGDGTAKCWGINDSGDTGMGTVGGANQTTPVAVIGLSGITSMSAFSHDTCAIAGGGVYCWGYDAEGELGNGTPLASVATPVAVTGLSSGVVSLKGGQQSACVVLTSGQAKCWGQNYVSSGQLGIGDGTTNNKSTPVSVIGVGEALGSTNYLSNLSTAPVGALSVGSDETCVIGTGGTVYCWGLNTYGQLGTGYVGTGAPASSYGPAVVNGTSPTVWGGASLSVGQARNSYDFNHACVVTTTGGVKCWGYNASGQLGNGTTANSTAPVDVTLAGTSPVARVSNANGATIGSSDSHTCVIVDDGATTGEVECWGYNGDGELGDNTTVGKTSPVLVKNAGGASNFTGAIAIAAGGYGYAGTSSTCAIKTGGAVYCWGFNGTGQVGDNTVVAKSTPTAVSGIASGATSIAVGSANACAVVSGTVKCWGYNAYGQLGNASTSDAHTPVTATTSAPAVAVSSGGTDHTCALLNTGGVQCWGANSTGELGDNTVAQKTSPVAVSGLSSGATSIAVGSQFSCATVSGGVKCWGYNASGQLGNGTLTDSHVPVSVLNPTADAVLSGASNATFGALAAGDRSACVLMASGQVDCWGYESGPGQLGHGTVKPPAPPAPTSTSVTCTPSPVATGSPTTCTATVTDTSASPTVPVGSVALTSLATNTAAPAPGAPQPSAPTCTLVPATASTSKCSVSFTSTYGGLYTINAAYTPTGAHTISNGTTSLRVTVVGNPTIFIPQTNTASSSVITVGEYLDVYGAGCPTPTSGFGGMFGNEVGYAGGSYYVQRLQLPLDSNGNWEFHTSLDNFGVTGNINASFTAEFYCSSAAVTTITDPAVQWVSPSFTFNLVGTSTRAKTTHRAATSTITIDPDGLPVVDKIGIPGAEAAKLKAQVDAIKAPVASVSRLYRAFFNRSGDHGGIDYWTGLLNNGVTSNSIADLFATSDEFHSNYDNMANPAFVEAVYHNVLGRASDAGGKAYWLNQLTNGMTQAQMVWQFANSPEFGASTANATYAAAIYQVLLPNSPSQAQLDSATRALDDGLFRVDVIERAALGIHDADWWVKKVDKA